MSVPSIKPTSTQTSRGKDEDESDSDDDSEDESDNECDERNKDYYEEDKKGKGQLYISTDN